MKTRFVVLCAVLGVIGLGYLHGALTASPEKATPVQQRESLDAANPHVGRAPFPAIGDSLDLLTERYGKGLKNAFKIRLPGNDQYYWEMNDLGLNVVIQNGKAVLIVAHRIGGVIRDEDIHNLIKASSDIYGWEEDPSQPRWLRRDKKLEAFRELHHEDMFFVQNIEMVKKAGSAVVPGSR